MDIQKINRAPAELLHDETVVAHCEKVAEPIRERARGIASDHVATGDYLRSIHIERHRGPTRTTVRVVADDWKSAILEERYHTIGRSVG